MAAALMRALAHAGASAGALRHAFFDAFTLFAIAAQAMSEGILDGSGAAGAAAVQQPGAAQQQHRRLLVLLSNCQHVRSVLLPQLTRK